MQLHKLELVGFKSFADKTEFIFEPGVTAFVGPNGCGKSNVVDAVKWVLGEQSAKALRGKEMLDLIYNGSNGHPQVGYAEASLTLLNNQGLLPVDYEEVCITRRIYRSGESEYLINKQLCRLKDIRELFMDTGIGCDVYSIIEQGQVDLLLQANPQERRAIFEEAAGIAKYKAKKREALARLERVNQNLIRVADIIREVEKQLRSVRLQARKALRYKEYMGRIKELELKLSLREYLHLSAKKEEAEKHVQGLVDRDQVLRADMSELETERSRVELETIENEKSLTSLRTKAAELEKRQVTIEQMIESDTRRVAELSAAEEKHRAAVETIREKIVAAQRQGAAFQTARQEVNREIDEASNIVTEKSSQAAELERVCEEVSASIEKKKGQVIDCLQTCSKLRNDLVALSAENKALRGRAGRIRQKQAEISSVIQKFREDVGNLSSKDTDIAAQIQGADRELEQKEREHATACRELGELRAALDGLRQLLTQQESRKKVLEELTARAEGIKAGVKAVLEAAHSEETPVSGIDGMLGEMVEVDLQYAAAIESALGEAAQYLVSGSTSDAVGAMKFLREREAGRAGFLPRDRVTDGGASETTSLPDEPGVIGWAADLVRTPQNSVLRHLLQRTLVVDSLHTALAISTNGCADVRIVTVDGELIEPRGALCGGSKLQGGIVSRKSELEDLFHKVSGTKRDMQQIEETVGLRQTEAEELLEQIEQLRNGTGKLRMERMSIQNKMSTFEDRLSVLEEEASVNTADLEELGETIHRNEEMSGALKDEVEQTEAVRAEMEQGVSTDSALLKEKQAELRSLADGLTQLRVSLAQKREKEQSIASAIQKLETEIGERTEQAQTAEAEAADCRRRAEEARAAIEQNRASVEGTKKELSTAMCEIEALSGAREQLHEKQSKINEAQRTLRRELDTVGEQLQQSRLELTEYGVKLSNIVENVRREYETDLTTMEQPEEFEQTNWEEVESEIGDLRKKVERLGNVNLDAVEEQEELEERAKFLQGQQEDLERSRQNLLEVIRRNNRLSREMFLKTFDAVKENFMEMFRKLFGGGRADIILEEGVDVLEAGIEIIACPPGKSPRSLSLLSGGEKTMTTVALLFAIFQAKPSPFCILDEVDAALDESNIDRFVSLLREFLNQSQFVIITHNKRTLGTADILYGITMQQSGVSKKIAVKFERKKEVNAGT